MTYVTQILIPILARFLVGAGVFDRVKAAVLRWEEVELAGVIKQQGVLKEVKEWGIKAASWQITTVIDLAVALLRMQAGEATK